MFHAGGRICPDWRLLKRPAPEQVDGGEPVGTPSAPDSKANRARMRMTLM
jgi:hypothetical protein